MRPLQWTLSKTKKNMTCLFTLDGVMTRMTIYKKGDGFLVSELDVDNDSVIFYEDLFENEDQAMKMCEKWYYLRSEQNQDDHYDGCDYGVAAYTGPKEWWDT